jgi:hypothetical protein
MQSKLLLFLCWLTQEITVQTIGLQCVDYACMLIQTPLLSVSYKLFHDWVSNTSINSTLSAFTCLYRAVHKHHLLLAKLTITINNNSKIVTYSLIQDCWGLYNNTFYCRNVRISVISESASPWQAFQPSLMFASEAGTYLSEPPCPLGLAPSLTHKH